MRLRLLALAFCLFVIGTWLIVAHASLIIAPAGAPTPPPGSNKAMVGMEQDPAESPAISTLLGYHPDFTVQNAYMNIANTGNQPCTNNGYPTVIAIPDFGDATSDTSHPDPNAAANGSYNSAYATMASAIAPCANTIYAIRLNWEGNGNWYEHSPWCTCHGGNYVSSGGSAWISASTWIAGYRNFVNQFKANPATAHIKFAWDWPFNFTSGTPHLNYYPGDAYVDIISADPYNGINYDGNTNGNAGCTSLQSEAQSTSLNDMAAFAAAHNKGIAFWEWGTENNDGQYPSCFLSFVHGSGVGVAESYWDTNDGGCANCAFSSSPNTKSGWLGKEVGWVRTYTFFGGQIPVTSLPGY